jgi:hypothetical protein
MAWNVKRTRCCQQSVIVARQARIEAEAKARSAEAKAHARALEIEKLKFAIAKLQHRRR